MIIIDYVIRKLQFVLKKMEWRKKNPQNQTYCTSIFDFDNVSVGRYSYGSLNVLNDGEVGKLTIGSFCSIADHVTFVLNSDHPLHHFSTFPMQNMVLGLNSKEAISKGDIVVNDDVWIAQNVIILSGVHIGQGAVIAAGAVVTNDVPPYAVVGGIPAKIIHYRFEEPVRNKMLELDYNLLKKDFIQTHLNEFYKNVSSVEDVEQLIRLLHGN